MPLLYKRHDPNAWVKKPKQRKPKLRMKFRAAVLADTKAYIDTQMSNAGHVIDVAIKLYAERRHELRSVPKSDEYRQVIRTSVAAETLAYCKFMRTAMTPGELVDEAIRLYRNLNDNE